jgi:uncharacterized protein (TIRG00374 family)
MRRVLAGFAHRALTSWVFRATASIILLWLVARKLDLASLRALLVQVHWGWLLAACAVMLAGRALSVTRVIVLVRAKGAAFDPREVGRIVLGSEFFGAFLPTSIGGDTIRVYGLRRHTADTGVAVSAVLLERATGVAALLLFGVAGTLWAWPLLRDHRVLWAALIPSALGLAALAAMLNDRWVSALARRAGSHGDRWAGKALEWQHAVRSYRHHPVALAEVCGLSLAIQSLRIASVYLVGRALGAQEPLVYFAAFVPIILLLSMLPISIGGLGVRENGFVHLFGQVGMVPATAFSMSILAHALSVLAHMPGGLWVVWGRRRVLDAKHPHGPLNSAPRVLWLQDKLGYGDRVHGGGRYCLTVWPMFRRDELVPVILRATNGEVARQFSEKGLSFRQLRTGSFSLWTLWRLIRLIRQERVTVLHLHGYGAALYGRLGGWITRRPVIIHQHDTQAVPWYGRLSDRWLGRLTSRAIAVSESVKAFCVTERALPPERVTVIHNAVPAPEFLSDEAGRRWRQEAGIPAAAKLIGSITRFYPEKGTTFLIAAMPLILQQVPEARLVLWGDGPERPQLEAQVRSCGLADRVRFAGFVPDAARYLTLLDCFVLPSCSEGSPFVLFEALAAGRPIVATGVGGIPELVRDGQEALLVPPRDAQALAEALIRVLRDEALAGQLGRAAKRVSERYTVERHVAALRRLYETVIS